jgi:hypothetical protein
MLILGILFLFIWLVTSFVIVVDMFKKHTAIGCLGLVLLPIVPFVWVFKGYSGNKRKAGAILYGSAIVASSLIGYQWVSASKALEPFIESSQTEGIELSLTQIGTTNGKKYYTVSSTGIYTPTRDYASVEEMLKIIMEERVDKISKFYPTNLEKGTIIRVAIPTQSGFIAVFEITGPNKIEKSYVSSYDDL